MKGTRRALLVGFGLLAAAHNGYAEAPGQSNDTRETSYAQAFHLEPLPEAAAALTEILRNPIAVGPRDRLVEIYRALGLHSVASFYEATSRSIESGSLTLGDTVVEQVWSCPDVREERALQEVVALLASGRVDEAQRGAMAVYSRSSESCESAILWAWCELQRNNAEVASRAEMAVRAMITGVEDGVRWPEGIPMSRFQVYDAVARYMALVGDDIAAAVAALRAESWVDTVPGLRDAVASRIEQLRWLQKRGAARLARISH